MRNPLVRCLLLVAVLLGGCGAFKGGSSAEEGPGLLPGGYWRILPTHMRIFPTTRFNQRDGQTVLLARVELLDEMEDSVKGVGQFYFELFAVGSGDGGGASRRLYAWTISANSLAEQRTYYDSISRAYTFPLLMHESESMERRTALQVTFTPPQGRGTRLTARAVLVERADPVDITAPPRTIRQPAPVDPQ